MSRAKQSSQNGRRWQYNHHGLLLGPIALLFGLIGTFCLAAFLRTNEVGYLLMFAIAVVLGVGLAVVIVFRLVPKAWFGSWSLDIIFEADNAVAKSERLWQVVLDDLNTKGVLWTLTPMAAGTKSFPKAHDPILLPSEKVRLWFDNSPSGEDPNPNIVRVAFIVEPLERGRDAGVLRQTIVDALLAEENRQRAERLAAARKA